MKKVILAYSGGLDTSVILKWLQEEKNLEVITYTADLGQGDISDDLEEKAKNLGATKVIVEDLTEEFISDYVFPMFRCNTIFEGEYLLGTAIARPLIAKKLVEYVSEGRIFCGKFDAVTRRALQDRSLDPILSKIVQLIKNV